MRTLINYIRTCFCKHEWECIIENAPVYSPGLEYPTKHIWMYRCKKCGCKSKIDVC
jgi:hypothetical protein